MMMRNLRNQRQREGIANVTRMNAYVVNLQNNAPASVDVTSRGQQWCLYLMTRQEAVFGPTAGDSHATNWRVQ